MQSRFILFMNPEVAIKSPLHPFDDQHQADGESLRYDCPVWLSGDEKIALIWEPFPGGYDDELDNIRLWTDDNDCRIGVALHGTSEMVVKDKQEGLVYDLFGDRSFIEQYHKGSTEKPYSLFCDALLKNDDDRVQQATKELDAFFFKPKTHDKALEILTELLPDFLGGTVPGNLGKSKKLWEDFKRQVELEGQGANDATASDPLLSGIEDLVNEVETAESYDRFSESYQSLYHKLGEFIER